MKFVKGFTAFAVCAVALAGLASCGTNEPAEETAVTAAEVYSKTQEGVEANKSNFTQTVHYDIAVDIGGTMTMDMKMDSVAKIDGEKFYEKSAIDTGGISDIDAEVWYVDGIMYFTSAELSYKTSVDWETINETYSIEEAVDFLPDFSEDALKNAVLVKEEGGSSFTATLSGEEAKSSGSIASSLSGLGIEASNIKISDVEYTVHLDEEYALRSLDLKYEYSVDMYGFTYKYTYSGTISVSDMGVTSVTVPEGNFEDLDGSDDVWV